jgi:hypothetical protein
VRNRFPSLCLLSTRNLQRRYVAAITVFSAALGAPAFAAASAFTLLAQLYSAARGECDLATWLLGDAPRSAYAGKVVWITGRVGTFQGWHSSRHVLPLVKVGTPGLTPRLNSR